MKKLMVFILIAICLTVSTGHCEVIGEHFYNARLDNCCRQMIRAEGKNPNDAIDNGSYDCYGWRCKEIMSCSECLDSCRARLEKNAPAIAKKLDDIEVVRNTPTSCYIGCVMGAPHTLSFSCFMGKHDWKITRYRHGKYKGYIKRVDCKRCGTMRWYYSKK